MARAGRLTLTYSLLNGGEKAQNTIHVYDSGDNFEPAGLAPTIAPYLATFWTAVAPRHHSTTRLAAARLDRLNPQTGTVLYGSDVAVPGTAGSGVSPNLPTSCALVVSLRTANAGRSGRGRIYHPVVSSSALDADGYLSSAARTSIRDAYQALFNSLNALTSIDGVSVYSRTLGGFQPVTSIDVGSVLDTVRGRRNKLIESRAVASISS